MYVDEDRMLGVDLLDLFLLFGFKLFSPALGLGLFPD